jgi:hypothetical protein
MKYFYSFFLLTVLSLQLSAQSKFSAGVIFSPELGSINKFFFGKPGFRPGYTSGINVNYKCNKNLSITAGIQYSVKNFSITNTTWYDSGFGIPEGKFNYSYRFIELPLLLSYQCQSSSRFSLFMSAGMVPAFFGFAKVPGDYYYGTVIVKRSDLNNVIYNKFIVSSYLGIGGLIKLSDHFSLLVQPNFKYSLTRINSRSNVSNYDYDYGSSWRTYTLGLLCGVYYQF